MGTRIAVSVIVVSLIVAFVFAQSSPADIRGTVTDASGVRLAGVLVTLTGPEQHSTATDKNGEFAFPNLRTGAYDLRFQLAGFQTSVRQVNLSTRIEHLKITMSVATLAESLSFNATWQRVAACASSSPARQRHRIRYWRRQRRWRIPARGGVCRHPIYRAGTIPTSTRKPTTTSTKTRFAGFRRTRSRPSRSTSIRPLTQTSEDS